MEREVVFEKYDWKLERSYNPEVKITALSIKKPENVDGISIVIDMDGFNNGKMLIDNLTVYIDSYSFRNLTNFREFIIQQQHAAEFIEAAMIWIKDNGFCR